MSKILDSVYTGETSLGPHYDQTLQGALTNIWRHKLLVLVTVAVALVIGVALTLMMPKKYTATAYLSDTFSAEDATLTEKKSTAGATIGVDASMLVETQSRLLQSPAFAQRVMQRVGLDRFSPAAGKKLSWLQAQFYGDVARTPEFQKDLAAKRFLRGLSIKTEPRVYLIAIEYKAGDPELAALIANAFAVEFLQATKLQTLSEQRDAAERELRTERATLGEKHPKVIEAKMHLEAATARLKAQLGKTTAEIERTANGTVTFAHADSVPSSPKPTVWIGVALLVGLIAGVAIANSAIPRLLRRGRERWLGVSRS